MDCNRSAYRPEPNQKPQSHKATRCISRVPSILICSYRIISIECASFACICTCPSVHVKNGATIQSAKYLCHLCEHHWNGIQNAPNYFKPTFHYQRANASQHLTPTQQIYRMSQHLPKHIWNRLLSRGTDRRHQHPQQGKSNGPLLRPTIMWITCK